MASSTKKSWEQRQIELPPLPLTERIEVVPSGSLVDAIGPRAKAYSHRTRVRRFCPTEAVRQLVGDPTVTINTGSTCVSCSDPRVVVAVSPLGATKFAWFCPEHVPDLINTKKEQR